MHSTTYDAQHNIWCTAQCIPPFPARKSASLCMHYRPTLKLNFHAKTQLVKTRDCYPRKVTPLRRYFHKDSFAIIIKLPQQNCQFTRMPPTISHGSFLRQNRRECMMHAAPGLADWRLSASLGPLRGSPSPPQYDGAVMRGWFQRRALNQRPMIERTNMKKRERRDSLGKLYTWSAALLQPSPRPLGASQQPLM